MRSTVLVLSFLLVPSLSWAEVPPDVGLAARQAEALANVATSLVPMRAYDKGTREDCVIIGGDGTGLVAQLELDRRGLEGGVDPATAAPWAKHIAETITDLLGTMGTAGRCQLGTSGAPGIYQAGAAVAYALHRYGADWPEDVKEALRALGEDTTWDGYFGPYLTNGAIDVPAAQLLVADALGLPELLADGTARLDAILENTTSAGGMEMNAPLYTSEHFP